MISDLAKKSTSLFGHLDFFNTESTEDAEGEGEEVVQRRRGSPAEAGSIG
jgi:hypothetical protein